MYANLFNGNVNADGGKGTGIMYVDAAGGNDDTGNGSSDNPYKTIQKAIDEASLGDTIKVEPGTYIENLQVDKVLTFISTGSWEDTAITAANASMHVVEITVDLVNMSGFTVSGATDDFMAGIYVAGRECKIETNNLTGNYYGIYQDAYPNHQVRNNTVYSNAKYGIYSYNSDYTTYYNNTVINNKDHGIYLRYSNNNILSLNNFSNNNYNGFNGYDADYTKLNNNTILGNNINGIYLSSSTFSLIDNNTVFDNGNHGMSLSHSGSGTIKYNTISDNAGYGIYLSSSGFMTLEHNVLSGNEMNFGVYFSFTQYIDTTNTINGKPIYYWLNQQDKTIPSDAGFIGVVDSNNITVEDITISNNGQGVLFYNTDDSFIDNVKVSDNDYGLYLLASNNNNLTTNRMTSSNANGLHLDSSHYNWILNNSAHSNSNGIYLTSSDHNKFHANDLDSNDKSVYARYSDHNEYFNNSFDSNGEHGFQSYDIDFCEFFNNSASNNDGYGFYLSSSSDNTIFNNTVEGNGEYGIYLAYSEDNILTNNTVIKNSNYGIVIDNSDHNTIYNNLFENNVNVLQWDGDTNTWNISKTAGKSIIGGPYLGGNYWSTYDGVDQDQDGLGDSVFNISNSNDQDQLPLTPNRLPITTFSVTPEHPIINQTVEFNASKSHDRDGDIVNYEWDFGDGNTTTGMVVNHSFERAGRYPVNLTVTDDRSGTNYTTTQLRIYTTVPPFFTFISPLNPIDAHVDDNVSFSVNVDQTVNLSWWVNGQKVHTSNQTWFSFYTHSSPSMGLNNVTVVAENENGTATYSWQLRVIDFSVDRTYQFGGLPNCLGVYGNLTFMGETRHLLILDTANEPTLLSSLEFQYDPKTVVVGSTEDNLTLLYASDGYAGVKIFNITDPSQPELVGNYDQLGGLASTLDLQGRYLHISVPYVGVVVLNVTNASAPTYNTTYTSSADSLIIRGNLSYVVDSSNQRFWVFNVSNLSNITEVDNLSISDQNQLTLWGNHAFVANGWNSIEIINVTDPTNLSLANTLDGNYVSDLDVFEDHLYIASAWNGMYIYNVTDIDNPQMVRQIEMGGVEAVRAPYHGEVYMGLSQDQALIILNTNNLTNISVNRTFEKLTNAQSVFSNGEHLFAFSTDGNLWVYNLSNKYPKAIGKYTQWQSIGSMVFHQDSAILINQSGSDPKLHFVDLSNILALNETSRFDLSVVARQGRVFENHLYLRNDLSISILNITNTSKPEQVGQFDLPGQSRDLLIMNASTLAIVAYRHNDTIKGFIIVNVTNASSPEVLWNITIPGDPAGMALEGTTLLVAGNSGNWPNEVHHIQAYDLSNLSNVTLISNTIGSGPVSSLYFDQGMVLASGSLITFNFASGQFIRGPRVSGSGSCSSMGGGAMTSVATDNGRTVYLAEYEYGVKISVLKRKPAQQKVWLTVDVAPYGAGTTNPAIGSYQYPRYRTVPLDAYPDTENGWNFKEWTGDVSGTEPSTSVRMDTHKSVVAHFVRPELTLAGGTGYQVMCPDKEDDHVYVLNFSLTANDIDDWNVDTLTFEAYGTGDEKEDLDEVRLYLSTNLVDTRSYTVDDGSLTFNAPILINAGTTANLYLVYDFKKLTGTEYRTYYVEINSPDVDAEPVHYEHFLKNPSPTTQITGGPVVLAPVINIDTIEGFENIQDSIDDSETKDGHTCMVCPGTYVENVNIHKELTIESYDGKEVTIVLADDSDDHTFHIMKDSTTVKGFTIKDATGKLMAGIRVGNSVVNNCVIMDNDINSNEYGIELNATYGCTVKKNLIHDNAKDGISINNGAQENRVTDRNRITGNGGNGIVITDDGTYNNLIEDNTIGNTDSPNRENGIVIKDKAMYNTIGGFLKANTISGNSENGVYIYNKGTDENVVKTNYIGTDYFGNNAVPNGGNGIMIGDEAKQNVIGDSMDGNIISGNNENGIIIDGANENIIINNRIGTNGDGNAAIPNQLNGILISTFSIRNQIIDGNVISGNKGNGTLIEGLVANENVIHGNTIGADLEQTVAVPNEENGIAITRQASNNTIGAESKPNIISGNRCHGVLIKDKGTYENKVIYNLIGTTGEGNSELPNEEHGVSITDEATDNYIGGLDGDNNAGNTISGNLGSGVAISEIGTDGNQVEGNRIGTTFGGFAELPNQENGVLIYAGAQKNIIGSEYDSAFLGNLISGNKENGIIILHTGTDGNLVRNNLIGTNLDGDGAIPNEEHGIEIFGGAQKNRISGSNIVSGNEGNGILITGLLTDENQVYDNYIGVAKDGVTPLPNLENGVLVTEGARKNMIGVAPDYNTIAGNTGHSVFITGDKTNENIVTCNYIGTNEAGDDTVPNGGDGVRIANGAQKNEVGEDDNLIENIISGNKGNGITITGTNTDENKVHGNTIGADKGIVNELPNEGHGVEISGGAGKNIIGSMGPGKNIISGNQGNGILISGLETDENEVIDNFIGTNLDATEEEANGNFGIQISDGAKQNTIGGLSIGNIISGNGGEGVVISGEGTDENVVYANKIGSNQVGDEAVANGGSGILISDGARTNTIEHNLISGNRENGLRIDGDGTNENKIINNRIGTAENRLDALSNEKNGVVISGGAKQNMIGNVASLNLISGNGANGVLINGSGTPDNTVMHNTIGLDSFGAVILPNNGNGVKIANGAKKNIIGSPTKENLISGNNQSGVLITGINTNENTVFNNYIGTDASGTKALPNREDGVRISDGAQKNIIGDTTDSTFNLISGNNGQGILISGAGTDENKVLSNVIGLDEDKTSKLPNDGNGILLAAGASRNLIGTLLEPNIIAGNLGNGIAINGTGTNGNIIEGNHIGANSLGASLSNTLNGIDLSAGARNTKIVSNEIFYNWDGIHAEGTYQNLYGNDIKHNGNNGIFLDDSKGDVIGNTLHANLGDGILCQNRADPAVHNNFFNNNGYGVRNLDNRLTIDARSNWWGHASGPGGEGPGTGDEVSVNVNWGTWIRANWTAKLVEPITPGQGVVDAKETIDTIVEYDTAKDVTITLLKYESNPGEGFSGGLNKYIDVHLNSSDGVNEITIKLYYTDSDISGKDESKLRMFWFDGEKWIQCTDSGVDTTDGDGYSGYIWARISADTIPGLDDLYGTPFGAGDQVVQDVQTEDDEDDDGPPTGLLVGMMLVIIVCILLVMAKMGYLPLDQIMGQEPAKPSEPKPASPDKPDEKLKKIDEPEPQREPKHDEPTVKSDVESTEEPKVGSKEPEPVKESESSNDTEPVEESDSSGDEGSKDEVDTSEKNP